MAEDRITTAMVVVFLSLIASSITNAQLLGTIGSSLGNVANGVNTATGNVANGVNTATGNVANGVNTATGNVANGVNTATGNVANRVNTATGNVANGVNTATGNVANGVNTATGNVANGVTNAVAALSAGDCEITDLCAANHIPVCVPNIYLGTSQTGCTCQCWKHENSTCISSYEEGADDTLNGCGEECGVKGSTCMETSDVTNNNLPLKKCICSKESKCTSNTECESKLSCDSGDLKKCTLNGVCDCTESCGSSEECHDLKCTEPNIQNCNPANHMCMCSSKCQNHDECICSDGEVPNCDSDGTCGCLDCVTDTDCDRYPHLPNRIKVCSDNVCKEVEQCPNDAWCKAERCGDLKYATCNTSTGACICEQCRSLSDCYGGPVSCTYNSHEPNLKCQNSRCVCTT